MADPITAMGSRPGYRILQGLTAISVRHFPGDVSARYAFESLNLPWSDKPGMLGGSDPWLAWRSPDEILAIGKAGATLGSLMSALEAGRSETAVAIEVSEGLAVFELHGSNLDAWLAHLVDAAAIPSMAGHATRARLADVSAMLLRIGADRLWLIVERTVGPYVEDWLHYSHEGTFDSGP